MVTGGYAVSDARWPWAFLQWTTSLLWYSGRVSRFTLAGDGSRASAAVDHAPIWYRLWCETARDEQAMRFDVNNSFTEKWVSWII